MHLERFYEQMLPAIENELESRVQLSDDEGLVDLHAMLRYHLGGEGAGSGARVSGKRVGAGWRRLRKGAGVEAAKYPPLKMDPYG